MRGHRHAPSWRSKPCAAASPPELQVEADMRTALHRSEPPRGGIAQRRSRSASVGVRIPMTVARRGVPPSLPYVPSAVAPGMALRPREGCRPLEEGSGASAHAASAATRTEVTAAGTSGDGDAKVGLRALVWSSTARWVAGSSVGLTRCLPPSQGARRAERKAWRRRRRGITALHVSGAHSRPVRGAVANGTGRARGAR